MKRAGWVAVCAAVVALAGAGGVTAATLTDGGGAAPADPKPERPASSSADAGFARDMAVHHQQAVEMSFLVRDRTDADDVRTLAYDIANTQANQRGMLLGWLDLWGLPKTTGGEPMAWMRGQGQGHGEEHGQHGGQHGGGLMPGMATEAELDRLRQAEGKDAEVRYLRLMTAHHKGGVHMARGCAERCEIEAERGLAEGMVAAQESELRLMADLLKKRGGG